MGLFDTEESLARSVAGYLLDAAPADNLLVVATSQHWSAIAAQLQAAGMDVDRTRRSGRLTVWDAEEVLAGFIRKGAPSRALFMALVAEPVTRLIDRTRGRLRIYGEMVELLALEGNYTGAAALERLWNDVGSTCSFTLLCGYSAAHFAAPDAGAALATIAGEHSRSLSAGSDPLGQYLLAAAPGGAPPR